MRYDEFLRAYFAQRPKDRMTIHELAAAAGVGKNAVVNAKKGDSLTTATLEKLVNALGYELTVSAKETREISDANG